MCHISSTDYNCAIDFISTFTLYKLLLFSPNIITNLLHARCQDFSVPILPFASNEHCDHLRVARDRLLAEGQYRAKVPNPLLLPNLGALTSYHLPFQTGLATTFVVTVCLHRPCWQIANQHRHHQIHTRVRHRLWQRLLLRFR